MSKLTKEEKVASHLLELRHKIHLHFNNLTCIQIFDKFSINAFHSYKLKQILLVVRPGFGQDMPA